MKQIAGSRMFIADDGRSGMEIAPTTENMGTDGTFPSLKSLNNSGNVPSVPELSELSVRCGPPAAIQVLLISLLIARRIGNMRGI
jgi:hypothetical protein